jgi:hypothetical protein
MGRASTHRWRDVVLGWGVTVGIWGGVRAMCGARSLGSATAIRARRIADIGVAGGLPWTHTRGSDMADITEYCIIKVLHMHLVHSFDDQSSRVASVVCTCPSASAAEPLMPSLEIAPRCATTPLLCSDPGRRQAMGAT